MIFLKLFQAQKYTDLLEWLPKFKHAANLVINSEGETILGRLANEYRNTTSEAKKELLTTLIVELAKQPFFNKYKSSKSVFSGAPREGLPFDLLPPNLQLAICSEEEFRLNTDLPRLFANINIMFERGKLTPKEGFSVKSVRNKTVHSYTLTPEQGRNLFSYDLDYFLDQLESCKNVHPVLLKQARAMRF